MAIAKNITKDGDKITWRLRVCGDGNVNCSGAELEFIIPDGLSLSGPSVFGSTSIIVPKGSFNPTEKVWYVGELKKATCTEYVDFEFIVTDITKIDPIDESFILTAKLTSRCSPEVNYVNNESELLILARQNCSG
jgi:hypothetical protein